MATRPCCSKGRWTPSALLRAPRATPSAAAVHTVRARISMTGARCLPPGGSLSLFVRQTNSSGSAFPGQTRQGRQCGAAADRRRAAHGQRQHLHAGRPAPAGQRPQPPSAWFSPLDGAGITCRSTPSNANMLPQWIAQRLAAQGQRCGSAGEASQRTGSFADRVEGNLLAALPRNPVKLALAAPARGAQRGANRRSRGR